MATDRELYEEMYARQLAEGATLEQAMRSNRASTPEDFRRAFGNSDDPHQQWRKIGGGNKMGSAGAAVNAARKAQKAARDAARNPPAGSYGVGTATSPAVDTNVNRHVEGYSSEQPRSQQAQSESLGSRIAKFLGVGQDSVFGTSTLDGTLMASHDKAFSKYPAAAGPDRWPGLPADKLHYLHPSRDPLTNILSTPFGIKGA